MSFKVGGSGGGFKIQKLEQHKVEMPQGGTGQQAQQNNAVLANYHTDGFTQTQATSASGASAPVTPKPLTPEEEASAREALNTAGGYNAAHHVTDWLRANPDPGKQATFMDMMFESPSRGVGILDNTHSLSEAERSQLSRALNHAVRSGAVTVEEFTSGIGTSYNGSPPGVTHEAAATIIAGTRNPELIEAFAQRELAILRDPNFNEAQRVGAAAIALSGLPPSRLQSFLANNPEAVADMVRLSDVHPDTSGSEGLGKLLSTAALIRPPTAESLKLFNDSISHIGENPASREGAANFFRMNTEAVLASMQDPSGSLMLDSQHQLTEFFARTLFTEPAYEGQEAFRQDVMRTMGTLQRSLNREANADEPSANAERQARLLGSLVGTVEGSFQLSVDELNKRNESVEGMVGLLFSAKDLLPDLPIPGAGKLKELTLGQLQEWVTDNLKEDPQKAADALPFHTAFGELIANPELRTHYDAARGSSFDNRELGL